MRKKNLHSLWKTLSEKGKTQSAPSKKGFSTPLEFKPSLNRINQYSPSFLIDMEIINGSLKSLGEVFQNNSGIPLSYRIFFLDKWLSSFGGKVTVGN